MDREKRYDRILELIEEYRLPVLCGKINYPGKNKITVEAIKAFEALKQSINLKFDEKSLFSQMLYGCDGNSLLMVINEDPLKAKNMAVSIEENHILGRVFDIDIYVEDGSSIGRDSINRNPRKCLICNNDARICIKSNTHDVKDVIKEVDGIINKYTG